MEQLKFHGLYSSSSRGSTSGSGGNTGSGSTAGSSGLGFGFEAALTDRVIYMNKVCVLCVVCRGI